MGGLNRSAISLIFCCMKNSLLLSLLLFIALATIYAKPCTCDLGITPEMALKDSDMVFRGTVIACDTFFVRADGYARRSGVVYPMVRCKLQVDAWLKGQSWQRRITIVTGSGGGDCGYRFARGKAYVVYAMWTKIYVGGESAKRRFRYTSICARTTDKVEAEWKALGGH